MTMWTLEDFVRESNRIEGILRDPTEDEIVAHKLLRALPKIAVSDLEIFVAVVQPGATLRRTPGLDVRVGSHIAPPGGPEIEQRLENLLTHVGNMGRRGAYETHLAYEDLYTPSWTATGALGGLCGSGRWAARLPSVFCTSSITRR